MIPILRLLPAFAVPLLALPLGAQTPAAAESSRASADASRPEAQPSETGFWVGLGLGVANTGIAIGIDASYRVDDTVYRGRLNAVGGAPMGTEPSVFLTELGLMYGKGGRLSPAGNWITVAGGLALVTGERGSTETFDTVGIPLEVQVISRRVPHLGAALAANLNPVASYVAAIVSIQIGRAP